MSSDSYHRPNVTRSLIPVNEVRVYDALLFVVVVTGDGLAGPLGRHAHRCPRRGWNALEDSRPSMHLRSCLCQRLRNSCVADREGRYI